MATKALPTDVLEDVAYLNDADEEEEEISILSFIARNFQAEQSRRITDKINAYHEPPLNLGVAGKKVLEVSLDHAANRYEQVDVHRDEDTE